MSTRGKKIASTVAFAALVCVVILFLCSLLTPLWRGYNTYNTVRGMYAQPKDSVQVAYFGTSTSLSGISPDEMYEKYGISSYNCSTTNQPLIASYYLLKEMERLQGGSLTTVVLDPSILLATEKRNSRKAFAERAIMHLDPSPVKLEALWECAEHYETFDFFTHLIPVLEYHTRWKELTTWDYQYLLGGNEDFYSHGQYIRFASNAEQGDTSDLQFDFADVTPENDYSSEEFSAAWIETDKVYLDKIVEFCREKNLNLVFAKVPKAKWDNFSHDALEYLAGQYGVPFLDMCTPETVSEMGLSLAVDYVDKSHPNIRGASKVSDYLGAYLCENYELADVRGDARYSYWSGDAEEYDEAVEDSKLQRITDIDEYLDALDRDRYTVFIAVKDDAAKHLSEATREKMRGLGLKNLANVQTRQGYVGILHAGKAVTDKLSDGTSKSVTMQGSYSNGKLVVKKQSLQRNAQVPDLFTLESAGYEAGNTASLLMGEEEELLENGIGLNFAVYNNKTGELLDTSCFNTSAGKGRSTDL